MLSTDKLSHIEACPECDLLIDTAGQVKEGHVSQCPRCLGILEHPQRLSIKKNFICVLVGLIFYFPAVFLPILKFTMLGNTEAMSIINCVQTLLVTANYGIALIVFFTLMVVPLVKMMLIIFVTTSLYYHAKTHFLAISFRWYNSLNAWGMLDIFLLGVLVSAIKLTKDAELEPGWGLYAFVILLLTSALQAQLINKKLLWNLIERHGK